MPATPESPQPRPVRGVIVAALVALACAAVPALLDARGRASRRAPGTEGPATPPEVVLARTDAEVVATWRARGLRGRTVVHVGRFLHFVDEPEARLLVETLAGSGTGALLDQRLLEQVAPAGYLRAAASLGIARRFFFVSPPAALAARLQALGETTAALPLRIDAQAIPRTLCASPPPLGEPVLLDVNASWFDEADGAGLLAALRAARLPVELVTVSLGEDATDVSPAARAAARAFAAGLPAPLAGGAP